jgi:Zn-dependent protease with chaperone function
MSDRCDGSGPEDRAASAPGNSAIYFDGLSSRRRAVSLGFGDALEINEDGCTPVAWRYDDIRRADSPAGSLRVSCIAAPALARLEIRDAAVAAELSSRCARLDRDVPGRRSVGAIVGWSLAAAVSIVAVVLVGVPLAADRLTPLVPQALERRLGDVAEAQVRTVFGGKVCDNPAGRTAFIKLVNAVREAGSFEASVESAVLSSPIPNAFALPGGKVYLFSGLLAKADNADEIAGILAHELGHVRNRDGTRALIHNGGTSFLIGLLFGDVTGSSALIFASRSLVTASYSREAERDADSFAIAVMHRLGRSPKPMGELMFRVTGKEADSGLTILANHPLTEDRLARMSKEDAPPSGSPLLTPQEWKSLKSICEG